MPLYKGRCFSPVKPVTSGGLKDTIYIIPHTNEQFVSKEYLFVSSTGVASGVRPIWLSQCSSAFFELNKTHGPTVKIMQLASFILAHVI